MISSDEHPRADTTLETLAKLKPAFRKDGTVTAGNASGINDGAAMVLLASEEAVAKHGLTSRARIVATAAVGCDPGADGPRSRRCHPQGLRHDRLDAGRRGRHRDQRSLRRANARLRPRTRASIPPSSISVVAPSRSVIPSAPAARACSSRCCTSWKTRATSAASPPSASAAAWASRWRLSGPSAWLLLSLNSGRRGLQRRVVDLVVCRPVEVKWKGLIVVAQHQPIASAIRDGSLHGRDG